jgi:serine/threonine protein kinase/Tol biopolymer transport system component
MTQELPALEDLVHAICEGTPVDWDALEGLGTETFRTRIAALRVVADIADVHRGSTSITTVTGPTTPPPQSPGSGLAGVRWAHLDVLEHVASGGFGDVYRAWDPQLDREVALKLLFRGPDADAHADEVVEEGRMLARVRHPHIVSIYGAARVEGQVGLWMEYVRGRTVAQSVAQDGALSARKVAEIGAALCDALTAVHNAGLVHRDVKAQNVMLAVDGRVVLMDFGAGRDMRHVGLDMAGTPLYVAPEVARGSPASPQSDVFSLGVLLRYAATGEHSRDVVPSPGDKLLRGLRAVVTTATAQDPRNRYVSAELCGRALRGLLVPSRVSWTFAVVAAGLLAAIGVTATGLLWRAAGDTPGPTVTSAATPRLTLRPLWTLRLDGFEMIGKPSTSGLLPLVDEEQRLVIADIDLDNRRPPVPIGVASDGLKACSWNSLALSPAALEAAFSCEVTDGVHELRVVRTDANLPVQRRIAGGQWNPLEWSHHAYILAEKPTAPRQLGLIEVASGAVRPLVALSALVDAASLSPDARWVVFDGPGLTLADQHDVFVVPTRGGPAVTISAGPYDDVLPSWTPRGDGVLFISDRTGSPGLWLQPLAEGRPSGAPQLLSQDMGRVMDIWAATRTGELIYFRQTGLVRTMTMALDRNGRLVGTPAQIPTRQVGGTMMANWSPDSHRLAYQTTLTGSRAFALGLLDMSNGVERIVRVPFRWFGNPRWAQDGRHVVVRGTDLLDREGVFLVQVDTGEISPLKLSALTNGGAIHAFQSGHANDVIVRVPQGFFRVDVASRQEVPVFLFDGETRAFAVSPADGSLAFVHVVEKAAILTVRSPGGAPRQLLRLGPHEGFGEVKWAADGRNLYFVRQPFADKSDDRVATLWRIDAKGGTPESLGLRLEGLRDLSLSGDGRRLAFTTGWPLREPWILENYLPPAYRAR